MDSLVAREITSLKKRLTRAVGFGVGAEEVAPDLDRLPRGLPAQVQVSRARGMRVRASVERVVARDALGYRRGH